MDIQILLLQFSAISEIAHRHTRKHLPHKQNAKGKDAQKKPR